MNNGTEYELDLESLKQALIGYEKRGFPVRIIGFPAYFMFLLTALKNSGIQLHLHPKSLVMLAGGWKKFYAEAVDKTVLYAMSEEILGLDSSHIREFFGAVEHPVTYADCPNHHFHVPIYSRVVIRDRNLQPVSFGTPGLLNLITPMITSMPYTSIITDDLAVLYPGEACGCGNCSPYFEILGRIGLSDVKTCAAEASVLLDAVAGGSHERSKP